MLKTFSRTLFPLLLLSTVWGQTLKYQYQVRYGLIVAGSAELSQQVEDGILTSQLTMHSSPWLSNLWSLSDSIQSRYHLPNRGLIRHVKALHEGGHHRHYVVDFLDSSRVQVNADIKALDWQDMLDIPSLLYVLSTMKFNDGDTLRYHLWDGRSYGALELLVKRQEGGRSLRRPFGVDDSWLLIPLSSSRKSRENDIQLSIQLSRDLPHVPERIEISTKYGTVQMRLVEP